MGQKVHPRGFRLGVIRGWDARWYARKQVFSDQLMSDIAIRNLIKTTLRTAGVSRVEIERASNRVRVYIHAAKPGVVIGKGGTGVDQLRKKLETLTGKQVAVNIVEVKNPDLDAQLVAESVASSLEKRISFKRAMKQAVSRSMRQGAKGVRVMTSGRLGGAEMHRREWYAEGTVPLHTLRADVDYGLAEAKTTYGQIGVKVWIYKGEVFDTAPRRRPAVVQQGG